ncbi:MAG TPA: hypothetical protein VJ066_01825 [Candidatus Bathyarchaeia archaeon]|nr:hypothetical protein [Candidatus Bathyarchaeia archaeon]
MDNTQIDEKINDQGGILAGNIEFNNHYYNVGLGSVTPNPPEELKLTPLLIMGWVLWGISIVATVLIGLYWKRSSK